MLEMAWWMWILSVLGTYIYGLVTVTKYHRHSHMLDYKEESMAESWAIGALWPILPIFGESKWMAGLLYPTLYLWPRFREEWPAIKAERELDRGYRREMRRKDARRTRVEQHATLRLEDTKAEVRHENTVSRIKKADEELSKALQDGPPEIERKEILELAKETEATESVDADWFCIVHHHWVSNTSKRYTCSDTATREVF